MVRKRSKRAIAIDRAKRAKVVVRSRRKYTTPNRMDLVGYDTPKRGRKKKKRK
ncbi:MAG: hypothetical protein J7L15_07350 [Clostridiales bacterium]|nr:hypothetical protein [Clostridiales bacterium]